MKRHISVLVTYFAFAVLCAPAAELPFGAPPFPPGDWQFRISIKLNDGFIHEMKGITKPGENAAESYVAPLATAITGSDNNPLITTNVLENKSFNRLFWKPHLGFTPIHKARLVPGIVKSTNEGWNKKYDEMEKEQFPEANVTVGRGWDGFSGDQHVLYCPKCRERRALWLASVPDLDVYRTDWANKKREEDHNKAIDGDEE